jgi:uncharacterized membrane protein
MEPPSRPDHPPGPFARNAALTLAALALLGFGVAVFVDHIASYYLLQWAPTLRRYPTQEERAAVLQALTLDRATHAAMWLTLAASLVAWRRASRRRESSPDPWRAVRGIAFGVACYAVARVVVEAQLAIGLVRVPNVAIGIDWHGPGFALAGGALLLLTVLMAPPPRPRVATRSAPR